MNLILLLILNISLCVYGIQAVSAQEILDKGLSKGKQVVETVQNSRKAQIAVGLVLVVIVLKALLKKDKQIVSDMPNRNKDSVDASNDRANKTDADISANTNSAAQSEPAATRESGAGTANGSDSSNDRSEEVSPAQQPRNANGAEGHGKITGEGTSNISNPSLDIDDADELRMLGEVGGILDEITEALKVVDGVQRDLSGEAQSQGV